ncbi:RNA polymerase sigma-70 factor, ECF subfamily [Reichenbachiella faecimaris]|uniref:RNA polymerase sigma-70 factor, ECF subfamily n=1 Tax=Reichenbachiella faecimaris TaxID=692418 RepID=A0A1W2GRV3_REIFA|nr:sigma-70 family RNA polymerase sigma factor [Reichenbachiella faecimaris]SMD39152.1 RNA polymerase sigma-70 factor, ECF subfamily [Reichenbachiella faecimaris]
MREKSNILDEWLVLKAQQGDHVAFQQLVTKWHKKLLYQSFIRTNDWTQSEDIVQDVWQWLVVNLAKLKDVNKFSAWIRTIVDRRSIDWVRKHQKERVNQKEYINGVDQTDDISSAAYSDAASGFDEGAISALEKTLEELNADSKLILVLYYLESNSIESIAGILCIPKGTVKSRLFHAREKLKKLLKPKNHEKSE